MLRDCSECLFLEPLTLCAAQERAAQHLLSLSLFGGLASVAFPLLSLQALLLYLQASELGMEVAQSNAAWMLDRGFEHAGPQAASVATALFKRSAEQGNVMSLLQLGDCYYYGSGVEQVG